MLKLIKSPKFPLFLITIILFLIPFFWLKPNEMDLGGDSNRLYFYDPYNFLINDSLYLFEFVLEGNRSFSPHYYLIPHVLLLWAFKTLINSPYFLISFTNGIKLSISFLSVALVIKTLLQESFKEKKESFLYWIAITCGLFYITAPAMVGNYDKALITQYQVFLNPLIFYWLLIYFLSQKFRYLIFIILITIAFSPNFSWAAAPPIFSFYPLSLIFLLIYITFIKKKKIIYRHLLLFFILLLGLHAFHYLPEIQSILNPGSGYNERIFDKVEVLNQINYFYAVLPLAKLSYNFFSYSPLKQIAWFGFIPMLIVLLGVIVNPKSNKLFALTGIFFLVTLYLLTANITASGIKLYVLFFYIPGFSMFRNFIGQWPFVFEFFYALLFGQALYLFLKRINKQVIVISLCLFISIGFVVSAWTFLMGNTVNAVLSQTNNVIIPIVMDPKFEQTLSYIRSLKDDGAFISFPFSDCCYTVVHGLNNGAYVGPSPIRELTGREDYDGYETIEPFGEMFFKLVKDKNYVGIKKLLGLLNIKYIYYNDNPSIYDKAFQGDPYTYSRTAFPQTQKGYKELMKKIAGKEIYHQGTYHIYETDSNYFHPEFYAAEYLKVYKSSQTALYTVKDPFFDFSSQKNDVYLDKDTCLTALSKAICKNEEKQLNQRPMIQYKKINLTTFQVHVSHAKTPYLLIFSDSFHPHWNISLSKNNITKDIWSPDSLPQRHIMINGYANAWYILPKDVGNKSDYILTIQLSDQKVFYVGIGISIITLLVGIIYGIFFLFRK